MKTKTRKPKAGLKQRLGDVWVDDGAHRVLAAAAKELELPVAVYIARILENRAKVLRGRERS